MIVAGTWRGQPLAVLVLIVAAWIAARAIMWEAGIAEPLPPQGSVQRLAARPVAAAQPGLPVARPLPLPLPMPSRTAPPLRAAGRPVMAQHRVSARPDGHPAGLRQRPASHTVGAPATMPLPLLTLPPTPRAPDDPSLARMPVGRKPLSPQPGRRWSADGWFLLRAGGDGALAAGGGAAATYGASQAGAVLRYRLAPGSGHRPAAYLRATAALNGSDEREAALGVSARPVAALPIVAGVELRASQQSGRVRLRPAAMLVSELPVIALPAALQAEAYVQAGYVGGRFATAFADGQVRVDHDAGKVGQASLALGAAAWGGAQKGVARLDLGPALRIAMPLGQAAIARMAIDWRLRVAGNAAPSSGPALTLSAGF